MQSCIYKGQVSHRRFQPVRNEFRYSIFMMYVDLAELGHLFDPFWFWSADRATPAAFRRADHHGDQAVPLDQSIRDLVEREAGFRPAGPIRLLTHFRYFGYCFNPLSAYYCFDENAQLEAVVLEVSNMPWRQMHPYVLAAGRPISNGGYSYEFAKTFHVSPFMPIDMRYRCRLAPPGEHLALALENWRDGSKTFDAHLSFERLPITSGNLARMLATDPLITLRVTTLIHWQALKLWKERVHPHPPGSRHMNKLDDTLDDAADAVEAAADAGFPSRLARRGVMDRFRELRHGVVRLHDALGSETFGQITPRCGQEVVIRVNDLSAYLEIATGGTIGAAEAYMHGKWTVSDLPAVVRILLANRDVMDQLEAGVARLGSQFLRLAHWLHRNTRRGSRRNIHAHYDLGNELFQLFLDPTMMYSAAVFPRPDASLLEASVHKLDLVCRKLALLPADHLLEIGTGWGGLAIHAARNFGCRVTTTTISRNQFEYATQRVREAGLADRVTVVSQDYRDLRGQFDKLVSIEMVEAVGHRFLDTYFRVCSERLKPAGRMLIQAIIIADRHHEQSKRSVDFIQKYIFPGGALPSLGSIASAVARRTDLQLTGFQDIGLDYAKTLDLWRQRFLARVNDVRLLGYPDEFIRMWEWYLAYCEGGFLERAISDVQLVFDKPDSRLPIGT